MFAQILLTILLVGCVHSASIPWNQRGTNSNSGFPGVWYFQASSNKKPQGGSTGTSYFASDSIASSSSTCEEPTNLPQQFMEWFRESTSDPTMLTVMAQNLVKKPQSQFDALMVEPEFCSKSPSTASDADTMDRALCPWEWKLNRDESREPKLISEAHCLCRRSRGPVAADCVPIEREFPVLIRIQCDESGNYQYRKSYQTITVGCHSVMPRTSRAAPMQWMLKSRGVDV